MSYSNNCKDWTEGITSFSKIESSDINEFKTNIDWLKDNLVCQNHNISVLTNHNSSYDNNDKVTHLSTNYVGNDTSHLVGNDATHNVGVRTTHYNNDRLTYYYNNCNTDVCSSFYLTHQNGNYLSYETSYDSNVKDSYTGCSSYQPCLEHHVAHNQPIYP